MVDILSSCTSILAGNSRVDRTPSGEFMVEPQLHAFRAGLKTASHVKAATGVLPRISVAFDHRGTFRKQFLAEGLSNSQKRNPRLSQLHPAIVSAFADVSNECRVLLSDVHVIHEDSAKEHLTYLLRQHVFDRTLVDQAFAADASFDSCSLSQKSGPKPTCAAITAEYFRKAASTEHGSPRQTLLEVFIEDDVWSQLAVYVRGLELTHVLAGDMHIRLTIVGKDGRLSRGGIVECEPFLT